MASEPKPRLTIELPHDVYQHVAVLARRLGISVEQMAAQTVSEAAERGMYVTEEMDWEMGQWVARVLTDENGCPRHDLFPSHRRLYWTPVEDPLFLTIIHGTSKAAPFRYETLLAAMRDFTVAAPAYWFYMLLHDGYVQETRWAAKCDYSDPGGRLWAFEFEPAAHEGGPSVLGLVPVAKDWLLWHQWSPCNDFSITLHGSEALCRSVCERLGLDAERGFDGWRPQGRRPPPE